MLFYSTVGMSVCLAEGSQRDGVAIFYKTDELKMLECEQIEYFVENHPILDKGNVGRLITHITTSTFYSVLLLYIYILLCIITLYIYILLCITTLYIYILLCIITLYSYILLCTTTLYILLCTTTLYILLCTTTLYILLCTTTLYILGIVMTLQPINYKQRKLPRRVCVGNTHLLFNSNRGEKKLAQLSYLLAHLHQAAQKPGEWCST